jgi:hypothetical protein
MSFFSSKYRLMEKGGAAFIDYGVVCAHVLEPLHVWLLVCERDDKVSL